MSPEVKLLILIAIYAGLIFWLLHTASGTIAGKQATQYRKKLQVSRRCSWHVNIFPRTPLAIIDQENCDICAKNP